MIEEILEDIFKDENINGFILSDERYKELKDYITNLQQEKDCLQRNYDDNEQAIQKLIKEFKGLQQENETLKAKLEIGKTCGFCPYYDYKSRCEKANDFVDNYNVFKEFSFPLMKRDIENQIKSSIDYEFNSTFRKKLKNILKGSDKE